MVGVFKRLGIVLLQFNVLKSNGIISTALFGKGSSFQKNLAQVWKVSIRGVTPLFESYGTGGF